MTTEPTEPDLVTEVEELLAKARAHALYNRETHKNRDVTELLRRLKDEVKANREILLALNNCQNKPVCGHCNALLRHATRNLESLQVEQNR